MPAPMTMTEKARRASGGTSSHATSRTSTPSSASSSAIIGTYSSGTSSPVTKHIMLPPNPNRALDNSLTSAQQNGRNFFLGPRLSDGIPGSIFGQQVGFTCEGCHRLEPQLGHFGTDGEASFENEVQIIKIPHLRNLYQKVGMARAKSIQTGWSGASVPSLSMAVPPRRTASVRVSKL